MSSKVVSVKRYFLYRTVDILFLILKGTCSCKKKQFQLLKPKRGGLPMSIGRPLQRTEGGKPINIHG
jgi:hypothetical protein